MLEVGLGRRLNDTYNAAHAVWAATSSGKQWHCAGECKLEYELKRLQAHTFSSLIEDEEACRWKLAKCRGKLAFLRR